MFVVKFKFFFVIKKFLIKDSQQELITENRNHVERENFGREAAFLKLISTYY